MKSLTGQIHSTAIVDSSSEIGDDVVIGPYAIVGPGVSIGAGTRIAAHTVIERDTTIGEHCQIYYGAVLGSDPQDLKYEGEPTTCVIGSETVIREYVTVNRGTRALGTTQIGERCLLMAYAHVAHDCQIGDDVILSNAVGLAGHVTVDEHAIIGGMTGVHQFVRVGAHAFVGGVSRVQKDVPPYVKAAGNPTALFGLNTVGLERRGFPQNVQTELKRAYRLFFNSKLNVSQALARASEELHPYPEIERFLTFITDSERGVTV
ncbi:MAG TPA: acyl-ACP--UDP-N-acetylglucosamine O-acyltransferase [Gemmatimonadota bacterium]|nr:acyl-ACP--UDP-N-acetylglucosamine O-acyltransferase [Gemmatimonadota bacterium]